MATGAQKFYDPAMHGVNWAWYKAEYAKFPPHISNNWDYAYMLSELLGELNASHTGSGRCPQAKPEDDATASLGAFYDDAHTGAGVKIAEIMDKSPLAKASSQVKPGVIIEKIDGADITPEQDFAGLLNRKAGKEVLLSLWNPEAKKRWEEVVKPISLGQERELLYERWVETRRKEVERLSGGRLGYVHVAGMKGGICSWKKRWKRCFSKLTRRKNANGVILRLNNQRRGKITYYIFFLARFRLIYKFILYAFCPFFVLSVFREC